MFKAVGGVKEHLVDALFDPCPFVFGALEPDDCTHKVGESLVKWVDEEGDMVV